MLKTGKDLEDIEIQMLLEAVFRCYGFDFRDYATASLKRRIWKCIRDENLDNVSGFQGKVLHDPAAMERFLLALSINVTAMFRDPVFFLAFRNEIVPMLKTYPFFRVWCAGCSTGEEVYSLAILLREEGLYDRAKIYATDMNDDVLERARAGIFPIKAMKEYTENYIEAGGSGSFSRYYHADDQNAIFQPSLKENIVWSQHNLACDGSFNEFHAILCRNVMIYFNKSLQDRVHKLLYDSLGMFCFLCLGNRESIKFTPFEDRYEVLNERAKMYRKVR
jgi:chemotaxis protein methyltransferase CheR